MNPHASVPRLGVQFVSSVGLLLLCFAVNGRLNAQTLLDHGSPRIYQGASLAAVKLPLGGIGAGMLCINGDASRDSAWNIWGTWDICAPITIPNSFFAIRAQAGTGAAVVRALQKSAVGSWQGIAGVTLQAEFPFGWYSFTDATLPVKVSLEASSPFIPLDSKNSAIPCAIYRFALENTGAQNVSVSLLGTQLNLIGTTVATTLAAGSSRYAVERNYGSNINSVIRENGSTFLRLRSSGSATAAYYGDLTLMAWKRATGVTAAASWSTLDALLADFSEDGALTGSDSAGPSAAGQTISGALSSSLTLAPGQKDTVTFVLTWHFPNRPTNWGPNTNPPARNYVGPQYANWWTNALGVARFLNDSLGGLMQRTRWFHDVYYTSNLPYTLLDAAMNNMAILHTPTVFWNKDGYFGVNEGWRPEDDYDAHCTHVMAYAQGHAALFPEIARTIRQGVFQYQYQSSGGIQARFNPPGDGIAIDGQFAEILAVYREYQRSPNSAWLTQMWPKAKHAMEYAITTWDSNEDGIIQGMGNQANTLDGSINGSSSWMGSLYLAALCAARNMATLQSDAAFVTRCSTVLAAGKTNQDNTLYSASQGYYVQIMQSSGGDNYGNGCEIDQLFGQTWANVLGLGTLYPSDHVKTALRNLFKNNFHHNFNGYSWDGWRQFASSSDSGLIVCSWPAGSTKPDPPIGYNTEVMTGFEYEAACAMISAGLLTEGFSVINGIRGRYNGTLRTDWNDGGGGIFNNTLPCGDPFNEEEFGYYYVRALASWGTIPSCQGFVFNGPEKSISFHPVFKPGDHSSFFIGSEGYGTFAQTRTATGQRDDIAVKSGQLVVRQLDLYLDSTSIAQSAAVYLNGATQPATVTFGGLSQSGNVHVAFANDVTVSAGGLLEVIIGTGSPTAVGLHRAGGIAPRLRAIAGCRIIVTAPGAQATLGIVDARGRVVRTALVNGSAAIDLRGLAGGAYFVTVKDNESTVVDRVIVR